MVISPEATSWPCPLHSRNQGEGQVTGHRQGFHSCLLCRGTSREPGTGGPIRGVSEGRTRGQAEVGPRSKGQVALCFAFIYSLARGM